jgi:archaellum biogenesis protein FlaJ (TadC family)
VRNKMSIEWRARTVIHNIWTSAILTVLFAIVISVIVELTLGTTAEEKLSKTYIWPFVGTIFVILILLRWPRNQNK